ncbi:hypothetical protein E4U61_000173 [Claviceps capensis]|nr:hypothetical protein E4U61_000173 [Claviceps capensis]
MASHSINEIDDDEPHPNHPKNIGQQFDDSGNSVHTDKASSRTRAHRYYQTGQHNNIATAGPSNQNDTTLQQQHESQQQARSQQFRTQTHDPTRHTKGQQQTAGPSGNYGITGYNGVPAYGFPDPYWNSQRPYGRGPPNNPGRPGPSGPQGHSGYDAPFGPYGGGYNGPFGPYGYSGNTAATNGPHPQHNYNYEPDYTQTRQSRTDIEYEDRRFQRCQDTLIKAYTEKGAPTERKFAAFLQQYEGPPENCEIDEESDELDDEDLPAWQYVQTPEFAAEHSDGQRAHMTMTQFFTTTDPPHPTEDSVVNVLRDNVCVHALSGTDPHQRTETQERDADGERRTPRERTSGRTSR